jgi:gamma-glutamyltranspeptidase/glutathione hydrolase
MSAAEALAASRLHNQILPNVSYIEPASSKPGQTPVKGFSQEVAKGLQEKGHVLEWVVNRSTPCAIKFKYSEQAEGGVQWEVAGDPRKHDSGGSVYYS